MGAEFKGGVITRVRESKRVTAVMGGGDGVVGGMGTWGEGVWYLGMTKIGHVRNIGGRICGLVLLPTWSDTRRNRPET